MSATDARCTSEISYLTAHLIAVSVGRSLGHFVQLLRLSHPGGTLFPLLQRIAPQVWIHHLSELDVGAVQLQLQVLGGLHELFPLPGPRLCTRNGRVLWPPLTPG